MVEILPEDEERCEDAPESIYQLASSCCRVIVLRTFARAAWFQEAVGSSPGPYEP